MTAQLFTGAAEPDTDRTVVGENLSLPLFRTLSGVLAGHPYLKVVVDRAENTWHLLDTAAHPFHVNYIATRVLGMELAELDADLDAFNASVYMDPGRRFLLGVLSLHTGEGAEGRERTFLVLETTEADTMHGELLEFFYEFVRVRVDGRLPLLLKPANHGQEEELAAISELRVPRILSHELFGSRTRTPLNPGEATGRLRFFRTNEEYAEYAAAEAGLGWADIVAMPCLPDDVPRVAGFLNTAPITPLSHTNVLASGWGYPTRSCSIWRSSSSGAAWTELGSATGCARTRSPWSGWTRNRSCGLRPGTSSASASNRRCSKTPPCWPCTGCAAPTATGTAPRRPTSANCTTYSTAVRPT